MRGMVAWCWDHHCHHHSTHGPPHEQLLVRLEVGSVSLFIIPSLLLLIVATATHCCHCYSTHDPPHKQWLMRLGAGGASFGVGPVCVISYR